MEPINDIKVTVDCLFCRTPLQKPGGVEFKSGDLVKCHNCGEENDFDSAFEVAKEKGIEQMRDAIEGALEKEFKGLFKRKP